MCIIPPATTISYGHPPHIVSKAATLALLNEVILAKKQRSHIRTPAEKHMGLLSLQIHGSITHGPVFHVSPVHEAICPHQRNPLCCLNCLNVQHRLATLQRKLFQLLYQPPAG